MKYNISVVGLGYVGLPLAIEFAKYFKVIGYDKNISRIRELKKSYDKNNEIKRNDLLKSKISFTDKINLIKNSNIFIITLPTPITKNKLPDLRGIIEVTKKIGKILKKGDLVIYESTFYPGTVRKICIPILEKNSKMSINLDFYCGYSPERINPGDNKNKLTNITKVVSGSNSKALSIVNSIYKKIIRKGTHKAQSLEVAEAAKIIENVQRDINIALMNELYFLFHKTNINFYDILKASSTKWNFLNFKPGLVGGHCIGIDPYYLNYYANKNKYKTNIISAGRKINDNVHKKLCDIIKKKCKHRNIDLKKSNVLIFGFSFKENCNDVRNTKVYELYKILKKKTKTIDIYDPIANSKDSKEFYNIPLLSEYKNKKKYNIVIFLVAHKIFLHQYVKIKKILKKNYLIFDYKNIFNNKKNVINF